MPDTALYSPQAQSRAQEVWTKKCCTFLSTVIEPSQMKNWIEPIQAIAYEDKEFVLRVPSEEFADHLEDKFANEINKMIDLYLDGNSTVLQFIYPKQKSVPAPQAEQVSPSVSERKAESYVTALNDALRFETFIESESNRVPRTVAEQIAINPGQAPFNILFIHGPSGVGKTHLVQAIGQRVHELHPELRVCYVSCAKFEAQYSRDARFKEKFAFIEFYQQMDVLIIDDIQGLVGKPKTQEAFFEIFNHLYQLNKQMVFTCDVPPVEFRDMEERIITRIKSSIMLPLKRPDLELRKRILCNRAAAIGVELEDEIIHYIATNMQSNVRELDGAIKTLLTYAQIQQRQIDLQLASAVMSQSVCMSKPEITMDMIQAFVAEEYQIELADLRKSTRKATIALPRQIVMYLTKRYTDLTLGAIADRLGRKNHTTVMHGIKSINDRIETDMEFAQSMIVLEGKLKQLS